MISRSKLKEEDEMSEEFVRLYDKYLAYFERVSDDALGKAVRAALRFHSQGHEDTELQSAAGMAYDVITTDINYLEAFGDD